MAERWWFVAPAEHWWAGRLVGQWTPSSAAGADCSRSVVGLPDPLILPPSGQAARSARDPSPDTFGHGVVRRQGYVRPPDAGAGLRIRAPGAGRPDRAERILLVTALDPGRAHPSGADLRPTPRTARTTTKEATVTTRHPSTLSRRAPLFASATAPTQYSPARRAPAPRDLERAAVHGQGPAREPAARRGDAAGPGVGRRRPRPGHLGSIGSRRGGAPVHAGAGHPAGLHRRAVRGRPRGHARRDGRDGRRPVAHQPAGAGRPGDRPLASRSTSSARDAAFLINVEREYERNGERYALLRWAQQAFADFRVVPPGTGIVHQVNLEFLADVVARARRRARSPTRWSGPTRTRR